jgi:hypothetical protein
MLQLLELPRIYSSIDCFLNCEEEVFPILDYTIAGLFQWAKHIILKVYIIFTMRSGFWDRIEEKHGSLPRERWD